MDVNLGNGIFNLMIQDERVMNAPSQSHMIDQQLALELLQLGFSVAILRTCVGTIAGTCNMLKVKKDDYMSRQFRKVFRSDMDCSGDARPINLELAFDHLPGCIARSVRFIPTGS